MVYVAKKSASDLTHSTTVGFHSRSLAFLVSYHNSPRTVGCYTMENLIDSPYLDSPDMSRLAGKIFVGVS